MPYPFASSQGDQGSELIDKRDLGYRITLPGFWACDGKTVCRNSFLSLEAIFLQKERKKTKEWNPLCPQLPSVEVTFDFCGDGILVGGHRSIFY